MNITFVQLLGPCLCLKLIYTLCLPTYLNHMYILTEVNLLPALFFQQQVMILYVATVHP